MRIAAMLFSLSLASSALAQPAVKVGSITPDHGPAGGGTTVTIDGAGFDAGILIDPPCVDGEFLTIGGSVPQIVDVTATRIVAVTKPYTNGRFDVVVNVACQTATLKNGFTYGDGLWERVLLPVVVAATRGAHGSLWVSEAGGFNAGFEGRITSNPQIACDRPGGSCDGYTSSGPFTPSVTTDQHTPGRLVYIGTFNPSRVFLNLRVRDLSRATESLGTELPVVREDDAFGPMRNVPLANIPLGALYRAKLRIYRIDVGEPVTVAVDFTDASHHTITTRSVTLSTEPLTNGFLLYPGYAELDLDTMPELAGLASVSALVHTPAEGLYYALVSVTNNDTQQITTVSPR